MNTDELDIPDGWIMKDSPWMLREHWDEITSRAGNDNIKIVSGSAIQRTENYQLLELVRVSFFISPEGVANLQKSI